MAHMPPISSPTSSASILMQLINDEVVSVPMCTPVYSDGPGSFKMALGNGSAKANVVGVVLDLLIAAAKSGSVISAGVVTATSAKWDAVCGTSGGLTYGVTYYLSTTVPGALTTVATSTVPVIVGLGPTIGAIVTGKGAGGTITGVTAGTGLTGGGTSGGVSLAIAPTTVTAGSYTSANLSIGSDGRITAAANGAGGGVTNSAGNNVVTKSNGTNLIASALTDTGSVVTYTGNQLQITPSTAGIGPVLGFNPSGQTAWAMYMLGSSSDLRLYNGGDVVVWNGLNGKMFQNYDFQVAGLTTLVGDLVMPTPTASSAPGAGAKFFTADVATRYMPSVYPSVGMPYNFQPHVGRHRHMELVPAPQQNVINGFNSTANATWGAFTARSLVAGSNWVQATRRIGVVSTAVAGQGGNLIDTFNSFFIGNTAGLGGFHFICKFSITDAAVVGTANMFVGLALNAITTDVQPQTLAQIVGVGCTSGDTAMQVYGAGASVQARTSLGVGFPCNTSATDLYEWIMFCPPNGATIYYRLNRLNTGTSVSGSLTGVAIPGNTQLLYPGIHRSNGGTAATVAFDFCSLYVESEN